ncbi:MAG: hypothetical protein QOK44_1489, partial [Betaproteobacteria bacterium]|nr:hypothetical protein [Betaproteobacteria bacterium]
RPCIMSVGPTVTISGISTSVIADANVLVLDRDVDRGVRPLPGRVHDEIRHHHEREGLFIRFLVSCAPENCEVLTWAGER